MFQRRLCIVETGLKRLGKLNGLVAILLLLAASCGTAPTDTSTPGPNATEDVAGLPTPVSVGKYPECEPDREWISSFRSFGNTPVQRMELGFRSEESSAEVSVPAESLLITGDLSIVDVRAVVQ